MLYTRGMNGNGKAAQIGAAVQEYQNAKIDLAHIKQIISRVADAMKECGESLVQDFQLEKPLGKDESVNLPDGKYRSGLSLLVNRSGYLKLLREGNDALSRLKKASDEMKALGITNLE